jgi:hypothetical protein
LTRSSRRRSPGQAIPPPSERVTFAYGRLDAGHDPRIDGYQLAAACLRAYLDHAGRLEGVHVEKSVRNVLADGQQTVMRSIRKLRSPRSRTSRGFSSSCSAIPS